MPHKRIPGIYRIKNKVNNKVYVGSGVSVNQRFSTHKRLLRTNKHFNLHLQAAWNKYGEENFSFEFLEITENLKEREEFFIKFYSANNREKGYNKRLDCTTNLGLRASKETKEKLRLSHLGHKRSKEAQVKISESQYKPVCQIDKSGLLINTFSSMQEAEKQTGIYSQAISGCCRKINNSAKGYFWCYERDFKTFKPRTRKLRTSKNTKTINC